MARIYTKEKILFFHDLLKTTHNTVSGSNNSASRAIAATLAALVRDFNYLFEINTLRDEPELIRPLVDQFCHPWPGCPLCGENMTLRTAKKGNTFYGCSTFPDCRGARNSEEPHIASVNDAMRLFLAEKQTEEKRVIEEMESSRFLNLDLDG